MRRRLPVIQPTIIERRAFLLGIMGAIAACSDEASTPRRPSSSGSTGSSSGTTASSSGSPSGDDGGGSSSGTTSGGSSSGTTSGGVDSGTDSGTDAGGKGCAVAGKDVGPPGSFAMGTVTYVATVNAFVGRDAGGLYAMYPLCTHAIGNLNQNGGQLVCTVHGARFSLTGDFISGPGGTFSLPHFDICLNSNGNVAVDTNTVVAANVRLTA
ncbi:MAG: Rieske (2Fe-2S) protein [Deltaproteobacteria bacterium]|nr:Rieske (2Fe-2S) protein [Deltaproteobacteria bacterium]